MTTHELKTWPKPFTEIIEGRKTFELRSEEDRYFEIGDTLVLREWDPQSHDGHNGAYTGRKVTVMVTYLTRSREWGVRSGFVCMSIRQEE